MLDIKFIRENPDLIREAARKKKINFAVDEITNPQLKASRKLGRIKRFLTRRGRGADVF